MTDTIESLRAQLAAVTAERDMLLRDDREAKRLMTLADGGRLTDRVAQLMDEWRNALAQLAAVTAERDELRRNAAEVEAMREVVSSAEAIANAEGSFTHYLTALRINLDALRARKVGG